MTVGRPPLTSTMASSLVTADKMEDPELKQVFQVFQDSLAKGYKQSRHRNDVHIKLDYLGEKRMFQVRRPVKFEEVLRKVREAYKKELTVLYTQANGELVMPIRTQSDLDQAVTLLDRSERMRSLRLLLTEHCTLHREGSGAGPGANSPPGQLKQLFHPPDALLRHDFVLYHS